MEYIVDKKYFDDRIKISFAKIKNKNQKTYFSYLILRRKKSVQSL